MEEMGIQQGMQAVLQRAVREREVAGANALVLHHGREIAYVQDGFADIAAQKPIQRDTVFRIFSMTKPVTGAAAMVLMEQGKLDLADPVSKFLPGFRGQMVQDGDRLVPVNREVTLHDLLSMTSGVSYPGESSYGPMREAMKVYQNIETNRSSAQPWDTQKVANELGRCPLKFQPGTMWDYGASADVMGAVIEVIVGKPFGTFLRETFFEPLEMKDTGFYVPQEKQERLAKVYQKNGDTLEEYRKNHLGVSIAMTEPAVFETGGAGLVSTIDDYAKFAQMLLHGGKANGRRILQQETIRYFTSGHLNVEQQKTMNWPHIAGYTYGNLMRVMEDPGRALIFTSKGEYGWDGWLGTYFANHPKLDLTFIMMTQRTEGGTISATRKLCNTVFSYVSSLDAGSKIGF